MHEMPSPLIADATSINNEGRTSPSKLLFRIVGTHHDGQLLSLDHGKCTIGSSLGCSLSLRSRFVHPIHCLVLRGPGGVLMRAFGTDTRVNGEATRERWLGVGDRLSVGPVDLELIETGFDTLDAVVQNNSAQFESSETPRQLAELRAHEHRRSRNLILELKSLREQLDALRASRPPEMPHRIATVAEQPMGSDWNPDSSNTESECDADIQPFDEPNFRRVEDERWSELSRPTDEVPATDVEDSPSECTGDEDFGQENSIDEVASDLDHVTQRGWETQKLEPGEFDGLGEFNLGLEQDLGKEHGSCEVVQADSFVESIDSEASDFEGQVEQSECDQTLNDNLSDCPASSTAMSEFGSDELDSHETSVDNDVDAMPLDNPWDLGLDRLLGTSDAELAETTFESESDPQLIEPSVSTGSKESLEEDTDSDALERLRGSLSSLLTESQVAPADERESLESSSGELLDEVLPGDAHASAEDREPIHLLDDFDEFPSDVEREATDEDYQVVDRFELDAFDSSELTGLADGREDDLVDDQDLCEVEPDGLLREAELEESEDLSLSEDQVDANGPIDVESVGAMMECMAAEPSKSESDEDPEESINAYMADLLARLRGESTDYVPASQSSQRTNKDKSPVATEQLLKKAFKTELDNRRLEIGSVEYTPREAPENVENLQSFRDVANYSARSAIDRSRRKKHGLPVVGLIAGGGVSTAAGLGIGISSVSLPGAAGLVGLGVVLMGTGSVLRIIGNKKDKSSSDSASATSAKATSDLAPAVAEDPSVTTESAVD